MILVGTHPSQAGIVDSQRANVKLRIYFIHPFKDDFNLTPRPPNQRLEFNDLSHCSYMQLFLISSGLICNIWTLIFQQKGKSDASLKEVSP